MEISQTDRVKNEVLQRVKEEIERGALYLEKSLWKAIWTRR